MNINARKPLYSYNSPTYTDEDNSQEIQEDSNNTDESESEFYEEEDMTNYPPHAEHKTRDAFEMSRSVPRTPQRPRARANTRSPSISKCVPKTNAVPEETSKRFPIITIIVIILAIVVGVFALASNDKQKYCDYDKLQEQYPQQDQALWRTLKVGIQLILNGRTHSPAVYLLVHHGGQRALKLVNDIARQSSKCFGPQMSPIEMKGDDFITTTENGAKDYGHVIEKYRAKLKEGNVFLIVNLNEIPGEAARALHTICDTYTPIAENVVIFLTLTIPPITEGTVISNAENVLNDLWSPNLGRNELDPLITRVTDQVIALKSF